MPKSTANTIVNHQLIVGASLIQVGSTEWQDWLLHNNKFAYQGNAGHFYAQAEVRRQKKFWYAYRRRDGKLYKYYLGKTEELTIERLERAGLSLAGQNLFDQFTIQPPSNHPSGEGPRIDTSFGPMTKINLPVLPPHLISRRRLTQLINTPVSLLYASSGFGKTTLLNEWAQNSTQPIAWLSIDKEDNQTIRFWRSVIAALQVVHTELCQDLLNYLRTTSAIQTSEIIPKLLGDLTNIQSTLPQLALVLDDFHHITQPEILTAMQTWLEHFPPHFQLVISGNTRPSLSVAQLRAKGLLTELDANNLRFTSEEGIQYLQQYPQAAHLASADLEKLVRHTEGWASGLTLAALALDKEENRREFIDSFSGAHIYLREYFIETIFRNAPPKLQEFLLKTSILKHLNGSLCDSVLDQSGSDETLSHLWQENMFIVRLEEPGWYRYNDLFAEMLLSQLSSRYPTDIPLLHRRAAEWYTRQSASADAIFHFLAIDAWDEAAGLIESMALRELSQYGEDSRLLRWLQELPEMIVQKHKTLLMVYLRLAYVALPKQSIERFISHLEDNLASKNAAQLTEDEQEVLNEIQNIRRSWAQGQLFPDATSPHAGDDTRWDLLNGLRILNQGNNSDPDDLERQLTNLLHAAQAQNNLFVLLMVGGVLARHVFVTGQLHRSEKIVRQVLEQAILRRGKLPETASIALSVLCHIYLERNELALAKKYLTQAQEIDPNPTSTNMVVQFAILRAKIELAEGRPAEALVTMTTIRDIHLRRPSGTWTDQDLRAHQAVIHLHNGEITLAQQLINEIENSEGNLFIGVAQAEYYLRKHQPDIAEQIITDLLAKSPRGYAFDPMLYLNVKLARAFYAQHKVNQAVHTLTEALRQAAPEHLLRPFVECGHDSELLLRLVAQTQKLTLEAKKFLQELLSISDSSGTRPNPQMEALTISATISQREQDVLRLLREGFSNRQMASKLSVSESTIKTHLRNIFEKLGVNNRLQAVSRALELHILR